MQCYKKSHLFHTNRRYVQTPVVRATSHSAIHYNFFHSADISENIFALLKDFVMAASFLLGDLLCCEGDVLCCKGNLLCCEGDLLYSKATSCSCFPLGKNAEHFTMFLFGFLFSLLLLSFTFCRSRKTAIKTTEK
jgi:hypothetical protein